MCISDTLPAPAGDASPPARQPRTTTGGLRTTTQILEQPADKASEGAKQAEDDGFVDTPPGKLLADGLTTGSASGSCFSNMNLC